MSGADLDPAIRALMTDAGALGGPVEVIETHAARVFLCGERAYKLKKPVDLGFLNFSTCAAREAALQAELTLNQPGAPQLYRRLVWITAGPDGALALGGAGERVEPVLEMARFDQSDLLDRRALAGRIDGALARDLADAVFDSHARAAPSREGPGGAARIRQVLRNAAHRCAGLVRAQGSGEQAGQDIKALAAALDARLGEHGALLDARADAGWVRRCHGDLHLQNIVLLEGQPVLFDALEFDEILATTDTLYDLAFLIMDLIHRGLGMQACALVSQYAARLDGAPAVRGLAVLPAFCGVRALIRAMVALERGAPGDAAEAAAYLELATACAEHASARCVAVGGLSGTGKSTLAERLAPAMAAPPGAVVIRADLERKAMEGVGWREALPKSAYTREASHRVYARQREKAGWALAAGCSVVVDAVHSHPDERAMIEAVARDARAAFLGLWLDSGAEIIRSRVAARHDDPSDADLEVVARQAGYDTGEIGWARIDSSAGRDAVLDAALARAGLD
jgi:hypothetical protein